MKMTGISGKISGGQGAILVLFHALVLAGPLTAPPVRADNMYSEEPLIHDAADIPSQLERTFNPPDPPETAGVLPDRPFKKFRKTHPFFRDAKPTLHLRNYYFNRDDLDDRDIESWAQGGWLRLVSGRVRDAFFVGATLYGSYRLDGSEDGGAAALLTPMQENITILGELYAKLDYAGYLLRLGRQEYDMPFLNRQDTRMIPNTFEGYSFRFRGDDDYALPVRDRLRAADEEAQLGHLRVHVRGGRCARRQAGSPSPEGPGTGLRKGRLSRPSTSTPRTSSTSSTPRRCRA